MNCLYVTTAIPYVNAAPHLGHALGLVQADVLRGTGGSRAAGAVRSPAPTTTRSRTWPPPAPPVSQCRQFVEANADRFAALRATLATVVRRLHPHRHATRAIARAWRRCGGVRRRGRLLPARYEGRYCAGCEQFYTPAELADGCCPEHGTVPEQIVAERNWFFRLTRYAARHRSGDRVGTGPGRRRPDATRYSVRPRPA